MTTLKIGEKEFQIKYGYMVTAKSGIVKKLMDFSESFSGEASALEKIGELMDILPELLLVGLQKYHRGEYGYDYNTGDGKQDALDRVTDLLDDYFDDPESNFSELLADLQNELTQNGFLASMFRQTQGEAPEQKRIARKTQPKK